MTDHPAPPEVPRTPSALIATAPTWTSPVKFPFTGAIAWKRPAGSSSPVQAISIQDNVGTLTVGGRTYPAVLAFYQPVLKDHPDALGGIFASAHDNAFVITTVHDAHGQVTEMVFDSFTQTHREKFKPTGTGAFADKALVANVKLTPFVAPPLPRRSFPGLTLEGPNIHLFNDQGTVVMGKDLYEVSICGAEDYREGDQGPVELYAVFKKKKGPEVIAGVFSLRKGQSIRLGYLFRMDVPGLFTGVTDEERKLSGSWEYPVQRAAP